MAVYNKFQVFVGDLAGKVHDLLGTGASVDTIKVYLSNTAPNAATMAVKADLLEIAAGNGYVAGGSSVTPDGSRTAGVFTLKGTKVTWTAAGGAIGPFQYVALYNSTPVSPVNPLIAWWDRGAVLTLQDGESFSVKFNNIDGVGDIFTLS